jgi:hypothetical protein
LGFGTLTNPGTGAMFELTDQAFARVQPLLPPTATGEPWCDHRQVLGGIVWKLHPGRGHWLLVRRSLADDETSLAELVQMAGVRWTVVRLPAGQG